MDQVEHNEKMQIVLQNIEKERKNKYWGIILFCKRKGNTLSHFLFIYNCIQQLNIQNLLRFYRKP